MKKIFILLVVFLLSSCTSTIKEKSCSNFKKVAYDKCQQVQNYFILSKGGKKALFDLNGTQITDFKYQTILFLKSNYLAVSLKDFDYALMNDKFEIVTPYKYEHIKYLIGKFYKISKGVCEEAYESSEPIELSCYEDSGLIDNKGKEIIPIEDGSKVELVNLFDKKMIQIRTSKGLAILDGSGKEFIPFGRYDFVEQSYRYTPYIKVGKKAHGFNRYGYIDSRGKEVIPVIYPSIRYENGYFFVKKSLTDDRTYGVLDKNNRVIVPAKYESVNFMGNGLFKARNKKLKVDIYNSNGEKLVSNVQEVLGSISKDGYIVVSNEDNFSCYFFNKVYDTKSGKITPLKLEKKCTPVIGYGYNGELIGVQKDKKWGFIDAKSKLVIDYQYDEISNENRGEVMIVKLNDKYGLIDKYNRRVTPLKYKSLFYKTDKLLLAKLGNRVGLINQKGESVIPIKYKDIVKVGDHLEVKRFDGSSFIVDFEGKKL